MPAKSRNMEMNVEDCVGLTDVIPTTVNFGMNEICLTCVDLSRRFVVFGSDMGTLFIFNRSLGRFAQPLRTHNCEVATCIKMQANEGDCLAVGHRSGALTILRLPSSLPGTSAKLEQRSFEEIHKRQSVSCLDWSNDGSKLFSADASGLVMMTLVDFENEIFSWSFVCVEPSPIVQISYGLSRLCVSSQQRATLVDLADQCHLHQIGRTPRRREGKYGIVSYSSGDQLRVITARPNCRLWLSPGFSGTVDKTLIFQQQMKSAPIIQLPFACASLDNTGKETCSNKMELYYLYKVSEEILLGCDNFSLAFLDLKGGRVLGRCSFAKTHAIRCVSVAENAVYVLLDGRKFLRFSTQDNAPTEFLVSSEDAKSNLKTLWSLSGAQTGKLFNQLKNLAAYPVSNISSWDKSLDINNDKNILKSQVKSASSEESWKINEKKLSQHLNSTVSVIVDRIGERLSESDIESGDFPLMSPRSLDVNISTNAMSDGGDVEIASPSKPVTDSSVVVTKRSKNRPKKDILSDTREMNNISGSSQSSSGTGAQEEENLPRTNMDSAVSRAALERMLDIHLEMNEKQSESPDENSQFESASEGIDSAEKNFNGSRDSMTDSIHGSGENVDNDFMKEADVLSRNDSSDSQMDDDRYSVLLAERAKKLQINFDSSEGKVAQESDILDKIDGGCLSDNWDIWSQVKVPCRVESFAATDRYMVATDINQRMFYVPLSDPDMQWVLMEEKAQKVFCSPMGGLVWRIKDGRAYGLMWAERELPKGYQWFEVASDVSQVALNSNTAWYLKSDGKGIRMQRSLSRKRPCNQVERGDCDWPVRELAVSKEAVWALRHDAILLIRSHLKASPLGSDWVQICPDGPARLVSISLSSDTGWAVDVNKCLWFIKGVTFTYPMGNSGRWYQVTTPNLSGMLESPAVRATPSGVYLICGEKVFVSKGPLSGHRWKSSLPKNLSSLNSFTHLAVNGLYDAATDSVYVTRADMEVFVYRPQQQNLIAVSMLPLDAGKIVSIAANLGVIWVADSNGQLFLRTGIHPKFAPTGVQWVPVNGSLFESEKPVHLACSLDSVWAVTDGGKLKMQLGIEQINGAWVNVDLPSAADRITKVFVGADGALVWLLSVSGKMWARLGITDSLPYGTGWTEVEGVECKEVALGIGKPDGCNIECWALDLQGNLYRRHGVKGVGRGTGGHVNPAGNYWKPVPASLYRLGLAPGDLRLWALDPHGRLVSHQTEIFRPPDSNSAAKNVDAQSDLSDFEMI